jgi:hypothetical protein
MNQQKSNNSYFLINAGHPRAVFRPPTDPKELLAWKAWLKGGLTAIAVSAAVALFWTVGGTVRPLEATVQMERLTAKVEQAKFIHPDTAHAITRFVDQNGYDCDKVVCSTQLQARNRAVRNRLKTLLAYKTPLKPTSPASQTKTSSSLMLASPPPATTGTEPK